MNKLFTVFALLILLQPLPGADQREVSAGVNATRIGLDDTLVLTLTFKGFRMVQTPELPRLYDFSILNIAQKLNFIEGISVNSSTIEFQFMLAPKKTGKLIIPTFTFQIEGKEYRTHPFQIEVVKGSLNPQPPAVKNPIAPFDGDDSLNPFRQFPSEKVDIKLKTAVSKKKVLLGEQVVYRIFLYTINDIEPPSMLSKPSFPGFFQEWFPLPQQIQGRIENIDGVSYRVFEIRKAALFPIQTGLLTIPALSFQFELMNPGFMFFATRPIIRSTPETEVTVEPLPPGQTNLPVGTFTFNVQADKSSADINDLVTLKIAVSGTGNIKAITPPLPVSNDAFMVYPPKLSRETFYDHDHLNGKVVAEVPLSFQKNGLIPIPALQFSYIDPETRKTVTLESTALSIQITGQKTVKDKATTLEQSAIIQKGEDIQFIATGDIADQLHPLGRKSWILFLLLFPFMFNLVFLGKRLLWDHWLAQSALLQKKKLLSRTLQSLSQIEHYEEIATVLEQYLTQRTGIGLSELSSQKIRDLFRETNIPHDAAEKFLIIKSNSEYSRYSPQKKSFRELKHDIGELKEIIRHLDRRLG